jgi:RimJ/RimL family protein N-acetyltransferase
MTMELALPRSIGAVESPPNACWIDVRRHYADQPAQPWRDAMLEVIDHAIGRGLDRELFAWTTQLELCLSPGSARPADGAPYLRITPLRSGALHFRCIDAPVRERWWPRLVACTDNRARFDRHLAQLHGIVGTPSARAPDVLQIHTQRLVLREPTTTDEPIVLAQWREPSARPHILRSQRDPAKIAEVASHAVPLARLVPVADRGVLQAVIERREDGVVLGTCTLAHLDDGNDMRIGWHLGEAHAGRGVATDAASALVQYAFVERGAARVIGDCFAANAASRRIFTKLGMRQERPAWLRSLQLNRAYRDWRPMVRYAIERSPQPVEELRP